VLGLNAKYNPTWVHAKEAFISAPFSSLFRLFQKLHLMDEQSVPTEPRNFISLGQQLFYVFSLAVMMASVFCLFLVTLM